MVEEAYSTDLFAQIQQSDPSLGKSSLLIRL
jgi:hypothetical protein